jgi:outer membrane lipoprotein SlyB
MENTMNTPAPQSGAMQGASAHRMSPLMIATAVCVMLFSLLGIAAITGILPSALSQKGDEAQKAGEAVAATKSPAPVARSRVATAPPQMASAAPCAACGVVESVRAVEVKGSGTGLGAVAGGVAGAVVGNQMGRGNGNTAMTILGAAGGAFAGNEIEKNVKKQVTYRVTVRMDDGSYRTVSQSAPAGVGEKVRVVDGAIVSRS